MIWLNSLFLYARTLFMWFIQDYIFWRNNSFKRYFTKESHTPTWNKIPIDLHLLNLCEDVLVWQSYAKFISLMFQKLYGYHMSLTWEENIRQGRWLRWWLIIARLNEATLFGNNEPTKINFTCVLKSHWLEFSTKLECLKYLCKLGRVSLYNNSC